jgi:abortive infection bacteriophage resistance protein
VKLKSAGFSFSKMKYGKPPLLYADRLSAYFLPFRQPQTDQFEAGTALDDVVALYKFDGGLRLLTMQAIDRIEVAIRAAITYHLAHDLGTFGYADPANFNTRYNHAGLMATLQREEQKTSEVFVRHYRIKYTSEPILPVWMATELLSFGALSKMFANLRTSLRKKIAKVFHQPEPVFTSWLHALVATRNVCAHHSRLWNRELAVKPILPRTWTAVGISNRRFYAMALILQTLLKETSPQSRWPERLKTHFNEYPQN